MYNKTNIVINGISVYVNEGNYFVPLKCKICNEVYWADYYAYKKKSNNYQFRCSKGHFQLSPEFRNKYPNLEKDGYFLTDIIVDGLPTYTKKIEIDMYY